MRLASVEPRSVDEAALLERIRERDTAALEALYDAYHLLVYGVALRVVGNEHAAEDVTQVVFMKIWAAPEAFRSGSLAAWLARVARNAAIDAVRRASAAERLGDAATAMPAEGGSLEDGVLRAWDGRRARDAMARIPREQREVIELGFFGGLSHDEIARRTGLPLGTVKTRIRSGLHKLRAELDERYGV